MGKSSSPLTKRSASFTERFAGRQRSPPPTETNPAMRKLIIAEFISVDGIAEVEKPPGGRRPFLLLR